MTAKTKTKPDDFPVGCEGLKEASARVSRYSIEERAALSESICSDKVTRYAHAQAAVRGTR